MKLSLAAQWAALDDHFQKHAQQVNRFRHAGPYAVRRMWQRQTNEEGVRLSPFEREALIERHCELFGIWHRALVHPSTHRLAPFPGLRR